MLRTRRLLLIAVALAVIVLLGTGSAPLAARVRINGSTTVNPVVVDAAVVLRQAENLEILVDTVGGSSGGIAALGDGRVEIGMSSRPLNDEDRRRFPHVDFRSTRIGLDAVALVISKDVWDAGIRALSRRQVRDLYEGKIANWRELGGPDRRVVFFNKEPGRGTWEVFAGWLYGSASEAPLVSLPEVGGNEEGRNKVASTPGAITQLSAAWATGSQVHALGLRTMDDSVVYPSPGEIVTGRYPIVRSLFVITDGQPEGETKRLIDFLLGTQGQSLVARHGYLPLPTVDQGNPSP